ncbi:hypothetical protein ACFL38_03655 [Candidatus Omnitrophota bacterium]
MEQNYQKYQEEKLKQHEALCKRCGACCGVFEGDPCQHLQLDADNRYFCDTYDDRLGLKKSRSGREFRCVPIRSILFKPWTDSWHCNYKKDLRRFMP